MEARRGQGVRGAAALDARALPRAGARRAGRRGCCSRGRTAARLQESSSAVDRRAAAAVRLRVDSSDRRSIRSGPFRITRSVQNSIRSDLSCDTLSTAQVPTGCQTVLSSRKAEISQGLCSLWARTTRLTLSAASTSSAARVVAGAGDVDRVDVHVRGEDRRQLGAVAGEQVDDAARQVRGRDRLCELERPRAAASPRRRRRRCCRSRSPGAMRETRPSSAGSLGREHRDDTGRLGHGEVEVRAGDGVRAAEHLRQLVGPAGVPDDPVDRALDLAPAGARRAPGRRRASPSSRRGGRAPGRGCTASHPPTSAKAPRAALTASRASLREARATFWPSASYVRPDSERGNAPPM